MRIGGAGSYSHRGMSQQHAKVHDVYVMLAGPLLAYVFAVKQKVISHPNSAHFKRRDMMMMMMMINMIIKITIITKIRMMMII